MCGSIRGRDFPPVRNHFKCILLVVVLPDEMPRVLVFLIDECEGIQLSCCNRPGTLEFVVQGRWLHLVQVPAVRSRVTPKQFGLIPISIYNNLTGPRADAD